MVFSSFVKQFHHTEKISFFQSAYPYLKTNNLTNFHTFFNTSWRGKFPHASAASSGTHFLGIDAGHYGLYYSIFNRDVDRRRSRNDVLNVPLTSNIMKELFDTAYELDQSSRFFISQTKKDIDINVDYLKAISKQYLASLGPIATSAQVRHLSTKAFPEAEAPQQIQESPEAPNEKSEPEDPEAISAALAASLVNQLVTAFANHQSPQDLNVIYPLYQSLKRNEITLPSIAEYNMVLRAIASRALNSELTNEDIESKLTTLLTVYQDILQASAHTKSDALKPNEETFNIILQELFQGANDTWDLAKDQCHYARQTSLTRSMEYSKLGVDLFRSVADKESLNLDGAIPGLVRVLANHGELVTKALLTDIMALVPSYKSGSLFVDLIKLTKFAPGSAQDVLSQINGLYDEFKVQAQEDASLVDSEYEVYCAIIETCAERGNLPVATKFLDTILLDYRTSKGSHGKVSQSQVPSKQQISLVMSSYIRGLLRIGEIEKAHNLIHTFNQLSYLPELSVSILNETINTLLRRLESFTDVNVIRSEYERIWKLYLRLAIRKDYHIESNLQPCREALLATTIKMGDHDRVFQLIKEILLKNHLIKDINAMRICSSYLYSGYAANREQKYYLDLLWTLIDGQSEHYPAENINALLSEFAPCLIADAEKHTLDLVLNSSTVRSAFSGFDLQTDNVYGLFQVSKMLFACLDQQSMTDSERLKTLRLLCQLSNQFTDTENHYVELHPDLITFKDHLASRIVSLFETCKSIPDFRMTGILANACTSLDIPVQLASEDFSSTLLDHVKHDIDLSFILNINYKVGVSRFLKLFKEGYGFSYRTWNILINQSFVTDVLERKNPISTSSFIQRLLSSQLSVESKAILVKKLVEVHSDAVNIAVLKQILAPSLAKNSPLVQAEVLSQLTSALEESPNLYARGLFGQAFPLLYRMNSSGEWLGKYFSLLYRTNNFELIENAMLSTPSLMENLSLSDENSASIFSAILKYQIFKRDASSIESMIAKLSESDYSSRPDIKEQVQNYYLSIGKTESALAIDDSSSFLTFYNSLTNDIGPVSVQKNDLESIVCAIISQRNNKVRLQLAMDNIQVILKARSAFVSLALSSFVRAGAINHDISASQKHLVKRFEEFLQCLRSLNVRSLSDTHLSGIIRFLTITRSNEHINVILNRLINNNQITSLLRFRRLEFSIRDSFKKPLVELLSSSTAFLNDSLNSFTLGTYTEQSQMPVAPRDFEQNIRSMLA
ncbi:Ribonuclease P protein component mitochondrial [Meyerozyma sp. JA9]|nr:Ribonuclease P protein component mitochondrial [Meyerozyma sp. JA9]